MLKGFCKIAVCASFYSVNCALNASVCREYDDGHFGNDKMEGLP